MEIDKGKAKFKINEHKNMAPLPSAAANFNLALSQVLPHPLSFLTGADY